MKRSILALTGLLAAGTASAITVQVDPVAGTDNGSSPFLTLDAALAAVVGADAGADVINLRTNGPHVVATADVNFAVAAADGNLTVQTDAGDVGTAVIVLNGSGGRHAQANVDGGMSLTFSNLTFIPAASAVGAVGGDGFQLFRGGTGIATIDMTDVTLAANDGSNGAAPWSSSINTAGISYIGDDWIDYFADTTGTLTNVKIAHSGDEALIVRGGGTIGADVTVTGDSVFAHLGGRGIQMPFGGSNDLTVPSVTITGTANERVRFYKVGELIAFEEAITVYNGNLDASYIDIVGTNAYGIRVDTDTCENVAIDHARIASSNGAAIGFLFATGDLLTSVPVTNSTFHSQNPIDHDADGNTPAIPLSIQVEDAVTATIEFTDCIFSGAGDQIDLGTAATVNIANSAVVTQNPWALGSPAYLDELPAAETAVISDTPNYLPVAFDVTDPANADWLRVTDTSASYATASSTSGELTGGNGNAITAAPTAAEGLWNLYQ